MANPNFNVIDTVSYSYATAITKSDDNAIGKMTRAIYVGGTGDINAIMSDGSTVLFKAVPVGIFPIRVTQVKSTDTSATNMVALF